HLQPHYYQGLAVRTHPQTALREARLSPPTPELPSSRTGLLPSSPLRTVHESFLSHSSSPSNASFGETRFRGISRRCKVCTLPHRLSFVACTIRTWSRRTLRWMVGLSSGIPFFRFA